MCSHIVTLMAWSLRFQPPGRTLQGILNVLIQLQITMDNMYIYILRQLYHRTDDGKGDSPSEFFVDV
jgi:hypothetical protein